MLRRICMMFLSTLMTLTAIGLVVYVVITHPNTPLPPQWNPTQPLKISHPITYLTRWKLRHIGNDPELCFATLAQDADFERRDDFQGPKDTCHIQSRAYVMSLGDVRLRGTETRCDMALATAMWLQHGVQPVAIDIFSQPVQAIRTQGSYNCRNIAGTNRASLHSSARALDVAGFTLQDGTKIELLSAWNTSGAQSDFLKRVRDESCKWFATTLGPDYNRAHADHFHFQISGWGTCR